MRARLLPATSRTRIAFARELRARQTETESRLWYYLRDRRLLRAKFRRQVPIGPYVADFLCVSAALIVEADGGQHAERRTQDEARTMYLEARGYRVLRFWNNDVVENIEGVMEVIARAIAVPSPPAPLPEGEGSRDTPTAPKEGSRDTPTGPKEGSRNSPAATGIRSRSPAASGAEPPVRQRLLDAHQPPHRRRK